LHANPHVLRSGTHYVCFFKANDGWFYFDDTKPEMTYRGKGVPEEVWTSKPMKGGKGYSLMNMYFYERVEGIPEYPPEEYEEPVVSSEIPEYPEKEFEEPVESSEIPEQPKEEYEEPEGIPSKIPKIKKRWKKKKKFGKK